ncbi:hypothetical protein E1262_07085 [Jiangella aurantiaca]|uniref:PH domain-containing protein n=1 Tax=Jiangella aurantiaca TaxID=2530373 RepID=A0A4R5AFJ7_9ACTN|nr:hypothetical protein [Jiangella aurantiaca]TDD71358.1 hypothetical protein E1262_07085 [Jiangella aurantiaca]
MPELVLRPTVRHRPWALVPVVLFVAIAVVSGAGAGWPGVLIGLGVAALVVVPIAGHLLRSRIVVTPSEIAVRGFVTHKRVDRSQAASVVRAMLVAPRAPLNDTVFLLDRDERPLLRIHGVNYPTADLDRLVEHLGLPAMTADRPVTAAELARRYPGIVPWIERHPFRFAFGVAGGIVVLVIIIAVIIAATVI